MVNEFYKVEVVFRDTKGSVNKETVTLEIDPHDHTYYGSANQNSIDLVHDLAKNKGMKELITLRALDSKMNPDAFSGMVDGFNDTLSSYDELKTTI